jgi:hypothetical protein
VLAYRHIPRGSDDPRGKCNIDFAYEAFLKVKELGDCFAVALDISQFFESLDHGHLKRLWSEVLGVSELPPDHFNVFRNITRYSVVDKIELYTRLGFFGVKRKSAAGKDIPGYLKHFKEVPVRLCNLMLSIK